MIEGENEKGETKHDQGNLKNRQEKENKREIFLPLFNQIPLGTVFNALEGLREEERLSYWHQECYPGDFLTGEVKRKP